MPGVEQELDALPRRELAALALASDGLLGGRVGRRLAETPEPLHFSGGRTFPQPLVPHSAGILARVKVVPLHDALAQRRGEQ